jgi:hypothetical protein
MPVKRRIPKRNDAQAYEVWSSIFDHGHDFFSELEDIGLPSQRPGHPFDADALAAWERYGARWLTEHQQTEISWAENKFGRPWEQTDAN